MSAADLLKEDDLADWTGHRQRTKLESWLRDRRIPYLYGKGGQIITTMAAINSSLLGNPATIPPESIEFE